MQVVNRPFMSLVSLLAASSLAKGQLMTVNTSTSTGPITSMAANLRIIEHHVWPSTWYTTYTTDTYTVTHCSGVPDPGPENDCSWDVDPWAFLVYEPTTTTTFTDAAAYSSFSSEIQYPIMEDPGGYVMFTPGSQSVTLYLGGEADEPYTWRCCNDIMANIDISMTYTGPEIYYSRCPSIFIEYIAPTIDQGFIEMPPGSHWHSDWKLFITGSSCHSIITGLATTKTPIALALKTAEVPVVVEPTTKPEAGSTAPTGPSETQPTNPPPVITMPTLPPLPTATQPGNSPSPPPQQSPSPSPPPQQSPSPSPPPQQAPSPSPPPQQAPSPSPPPQQAPSPSPPPQQIPSPSPPPQQGPSLSAPPQQVPSPSQPGNGNTQAPPPQETVAPGQDFVPIPAPIPPVFVSIGATTLSTIVGGQQTNIVSSWTSSFMLSSSVGVTTIDTMVNGVSTQIVSSFTQNFGINTGVSTIDTTINGVPTQIVSSFTETMEFPSVLPMPDSPSTVTGVTTYTIDISGTPTTVTRSYSDAISNPSDTALPSVPPYQGAGIHNVVSKIILSTVISVSILALFVL